ncbi:hypothetical protein Tco_0281786 [Tanacetum coccineum]
MLILRLTTRGGRSKTHPLPKSGVSGDGGGWLRQEVSRPFLGGSDMDGSSRIDILAVHTVYSCVSLLDPLRDSLSSASGSDSGTYPGESAVGEAASSRSLGPGCPLIPGEPMSESSSTWKGTDVYVFFFP